MNKLKRVIRQLNELNDVRKKIVSEKLQIVRRALIRCAECDKKSRLCVWVFVQDWWYEEPYGCTGGAEWRTSQTESCHIVCPKCGKENYIYNHPERTRIVDLIDVSASDFLKKDIFKAVGDAHGHSGYERKIVIRP